MDISVIICTYNRSNHLQNLLKSLSAQIVNGSFQWEIVVVDNNSMDNTFDIVEKFSGSSNVPVKYVKEKKQGLSNARNRGITESIGKYVAFIDDDAIACGNWLISLYGTFQEYKCDGIGGRIYLKPIIELPRWLKKELWGFLACLDYGDELFEINDNHFIYGTNMAFSVETFSKVGYFNTELGRTGYMPIGGEETELLGRILNCGGKVYYQPKAEVYHIIDEYKLRKQYFRRLHYYEGLSTGKAYEKEIKRNLCGIPLFMFTQLIRSILKYLTKPTLRMQMNVCWSLGFMKGRIMEYRERN